MLNLFEKRNDQATYPAINLTKNKARQLVSDLRDRTQNGSSIRVWVNSLSFANRQHAEGHTHGPNWPVFIEYASHYFNKL
ncbi:MAG: hypothetical protein HC880_08760 [Bacteroidia bacterium]|nr:hypothetical protein [Bacteroidia bacterium]